MPHSIENHVRSVIAVGLNVSPGNIRPETLLLAGSVPYGQLRAIALAIARDFQIKFGADDWEAWTSVADVILAAERAVAAQQVKSEEAA